MSVQPPLVSIPGRVLVPREAANRAAGCPVHALKEKLRRAGLRPTRQRVALGWLLFAKGDRHICAETLYEEARRAREPLSLATVYNTLHQFSRAGLLRQVAVAGPKTYFDTNVSDHHHFLTEDGETVFDIPGSSIEVRNLPEPPPGLEIATVEVIVHLRRSGAKGAAREAAAEPPGPPANATHGVLQRTA
jgi:Fur family iron response transcriptional regulator